MKAVRAFLFTVIVVMSLAETPTIRAQQKPVDAATKSAEAWLSLTDSGKYGESWDEASNTFKAAVSREKWVGMVQQARGPLGAQKSRKLLSAEYAKNPPSAPEGEYVITKYQTSFEKLASGIETVSMVLDKDGKWRAAGYFIKPAGM